MEAIQFVPSERMNLPEVAEALGKVGVLETKSVPLPISTLPDVGVLLAPVPPYVGSTTVPCHTPVPTVPRVVIDAWPT